MNIQVSAKVFTSADEQLASAAEVRKRLMGLPSRHRATEPENERIAELSAELRDAEDENAALKAKVLALEFDLGDIRASFMSQAKQLADIQDKIAGEASYEFQDRKSVARIVTEVLMDFPGVTWEEILSPRRSHDLLKPRHACMKAVCELRPDLSFPAVGRIFHRDHTTVLNAIHGLKKKVPSDAILNGKEG